MPNINDKINIISNDILIVNFKTSYTALIMSSDIDIDEDILLILFLSNLISMVFCPKLIIIFINIT